MGTLVIIRSHTPSTLTEASVATRNPWDGVANRRRCRGQSAVVSKGGQIERPIMEAGPCSTAARSADARPVGAPASYGADGCPALGILSRRPLVYQRGA